MRIYSVHPAELQFPVLPDWRAEIEAVINADASWSGCSLVWLPMQRDNSFRLTDVLSRVGEANGPVVIFDSAQGHLREQLRESLWHKTVVVISSPADSTSLWADVAEARRLFETGEPHLPRRLVVAVLIVRKLYRGNYWGGAHEKNFLWSDDLANGRGVDDVFKDVAQEVANTLMLKGILVPKYGAGKKRKRGQKYALNSDRRPDVIRFANDLASSESLREIFARDRALVSARHLDGWTPVPVRDD